ncbi:MAG: hypothetical protein ABIH23_11970 [bacterium]
MSMDRREFLQTTALASTALMATAGVVPASEKKNVKMCDVGWIWEGQGLDPGVPPSIYGLSQGAAYFGLRRVNLLFHPNDAHALGLLKDMKEVTCDITKWKAGWNPDGAMKWEIRGEQARVVAEAEKVSALSLDFPNVTGAFFDDLMGRMKKEGYTHEDFARVSAAAKSVNPNLKLWTVVYTHELDEDSFWNSLSPFVDIVNLWIWNSRDIKDQETYVIQCRDLFPDKPIVMGCYLRDYTIPGPVPVDRVLFQMTSVADLLERDMIQGFSLLASVLIDSHRLQAEAVRDFIAAHS